MIFLPRAIFICERKEEKIKNQLKENTLNLEPMIYDKEIN
jgi:hypothetical protein